MKDEYEEEIKKQIKIGLGKERHSILERVLLSAFKEKKIENIYESKISFLNKLRVSLPQQSY